MHPLRTLFPRPLRSPFSTIRFCTSALILLIFLAALYIDLFTPSSHRVLPSSSSDPTNPTSNLVWGADKPPGYRPKVFIASIHRNNAPILSSHWNNAVIDLVKHLGPENVFFSSYESGSLDATKYHLHTLSQQLYSLGVARSVIFDPSNQLAQVARELTEPEPGWILTPRGRYELRRIPHLAALRNKVLEPFYHPLPGAPEKFDVVLWLNDVVFDTEDIVTLLSTRDGSWDSVCALDFSSTSGEFYDTFALRDAADQEALKPWPFFLDWRSRGQLRRNAPVRVRSCWNGVAAFRAAPFYNAEAKGRRIEYHGVEDSLAEKHVEGSECCFIHADMTASIAASMGAHEEGPRGIWLNPNVRVGYNAEAYRAANPESGSWPTAWRRVKGVWNNSTRRWFGGPNRAKKTREVLARFEDWKEEGRTKGETREEVGDFCLVDEMQVLFQAGWQHV